MDAAKAAMEVTAPEHDGVAEHLEAAARLLGSVGQEAESLADTIKRILNDAATPPVVDIDKSTNAVITPDTSYLTDEYAAQVEAKVADLRQRITDALSTGGRLDTHLAAAIRSAAGTPPPAASDSPKDLDGALAQLTGGHTVPQGSPGAAPGSPAPLDPAKVDQFRALARKTMERSGVPADEVERRLDAAVAAAQRPLPRPASPTSDPKPAPGFGDGFADRWFSTEEGLRDLLGQNGSQAFKDSWEGAAKGTAERLTNPVGAAVSDVKAALNSPSAAYYLGEKSADAAVTAPGLMFGGETALARAGLVDDLGAAGAIPHELIDHPAPGVHTPLAGDLPSPVHDIPGPHPPAVDVTPHALPHESPMFDGYDPTPPGPVYATPDGGLIYPDDSLPSKPYAIPGTVVEHVEIPQGTVIDRFGSPYGSWMSPDGTTFAERALPPDSVAKPYYQYVVDDPSRLPPGWRIEQSQAEPWFHQPGGGVQYRVIGPDGRSGSINDLLDSGYLRDNYE